MWLPSGINYAGWNTEVNLISQVTGLVHLIILWKTLLWVVCMYKGRGKPVFQRRTFERPSFVGLKEATLNTPCPYYIRSSLTAYSSPFALGSFPSHLPKWAIVVFIAVYAVSPCSHSCWSPWPKSHWIQWCRIETLKINSNYSSSSSLSQSFLLPTVFSRFP